MRGRIVGRVSWVVRVLWGVAALLVVSGVGLWLFTPVSVGWYAYSPLSETIYSPPGIFGMAPGRVAAAACVIAGLLVAAGLVGWSLGRRSAGRERRSR